VILVVGQAPGRARAEEPVVQPFWGSASLHRLARLAGVKPPEELYRHVNFVNLTDRYVGRWAHGDAFDMTQARLGAAVVQDMMDRGPWTHLVALGTLAARALKLYGVPWLEWEDRGEWKAARCPHPSGRSKWWNSMENRVLANCFWIELLSR